MSVKLTAELIESFAGTFLSPLYDDPRPTPDFHREAWSLYCSEYPQCAIAAPRNHAKSTALTHDYILAVLLFREQDYAIIMSATEDMAKDHLGDIAAELRSNEDLIREFGIRRFVVDQKTDITVECDDGHQFRLLARGAEQKIRGLKWRGKRPGLITFDDIEDDEQVETKERRQKFSRWFFRAAKQALRDKGVIRGHGTILHEDALLSKLMKHPSWKTLRYRAHRSYDDFSDILWPEKFPDARLRAIQSEFLNQDPPDPGGYAQEYLNDPADSGERFLRKEDFLPLGEEDRLRAKRICAAADFAVSKADLANRTSFTIGGKCSQNLLHFLDQRVGRWDPMEWLEEMFSIQLRWDPEIFFVEDGVIWKSIKSVIFQEMQKRDIPINIEAILPIKDKASRGTSLRKRMRAGMTRWDKDASWYPGMEYEMLRFTGIAQATLDDQFDSASLLSKGFDEMPLLEDDDFMQEDEMEIRRHNPRLYIGRNAVTGY